MGNVAGALKGHAFKKIRRFNIENRTDRYLDKKVKKAAPKPLATQREIEILKKEMPDLMKEISRPNPELLDRLKDVYVSSTDPPPDRVQQKANPDRPLPLERKSVFLDYGYVEPVSVSPGRISLRDALQLLSKYQRDQETNSTEKLALEYKLKKEDVDNMVDFFKLYTLVESNEKVAGGDASPLLRDPIDNININTLNLAEHLEKMKTREQIAEGLSKDEKRKSIEEQIDKKK